LKFRSEKSGNNNREVDTERQKNHGAQTREEEGDERERRVRRGIESKAVGPVDNLAWGSGEPEGPNIFQSDDDRISSRLWRFRKGAKALE